MAVIIQSDDVRPMKEISRRLNLSESQIRQIEKKALSKLRVWCSRRGIELSDLIDLNRPIGRGCSSID